jgi:phosphopantetheinyl transferase (holo-ACP synthase)
MTAAHHVFGEKLNLPDLEITAAATYASTVTNHREALRALAVDRISKRSAKPLSREELSDLQNLESRPRLSQWALSISHCPSLGGLAMAPGAFGLGFDVEQSTRVSEAVAKRVAPFAGELEIVAHATPVSFWVAKESAIKAFGNLGKVDLNYALVEITSLKNDGSFAARWMAHEARGFFMNEGEVTMAVSRTL